MKKAKRKLDIQLFQQGEKGKKKAYIRVANMHGIPADTPFVVGTPGHCTLYGGVEADEFEQELLELVQYVMDIVNGLVNDNIDEQQYYVDTFHAMLIHSVVSTVNETLFAKHTDGKSFRLHYRDSLVDGK